MQGRRSSFSGSTGLVGAAVMERVGKAVPEWPDAAVVGPDWDGDVSPAVPQWLSLLCPAPFALISRWSW